MARPTEAETEPRKLVLDQIAIGIRAYNEARRASDPTARAHLYDFAVSHVANAAAKIEQQKREHQ
jgi:hypothetical protein